MGEHPTSGTAEARHEVDTALHIGPRAFRAGRGMNHDREIAIDRLADKILAELRRRELNATEAERRKFERRARREKAKATA